MFNMGFLGDFDRDYFGSKPEVLLLFIFFVLIVIVIMLNVLIAIVSDSYGADHRRHPLRSVSNVPQNADNAMVRSRRLFVRSRLELAAQLEQSAPRRNSYCGHVLACARLIVNLPFLAIYYPLYRAVKRTSGENAANKGFAGNLFLGDGPGTPQVPFSLVYGPWYFFNKLTAGDAAADRVLPHNMCVMIWQRPSASHAHARCAFACDSFAYTAPNERSDEWEGRVLMVTKRMESLLEPVHERVQRVETNLEQAQNTIEERLARVEGKMDRVLSILENRAEGATSAPAPALLSHEAPAPSPSEET